jgi:NADH-quinone oxidoreductase subunit G
MDSLNHLPCPDFCTEGFIAELSANLNSSHSISILIGLEILYSSAAQGALQMLADLITVLKVLGKKVQMQCLFDRPNQLGAWDLGLLPGHLPGMIPLSDSKAQEQLTEAWSMAPPQSQGADFNEMVALCSAGEMDALYIVGADPLLSYPDREKLEHAFSKLRLLVVQDGFFSSTAQYADILLPATIYGESGGSFTNNEGRVQLAQAFQTSPKGVKTDTELFGWMAENLGVDLGSMEPETLFAEICRLVPGYQLLGNGAVGTTSEFTEEIPAQLEIKLFCPEISPRDTPEGFMLITGNCRSHSGHLSEKSKTLNTIQDQAYLTLNTRDAEVWDIHPDDLVIVKANGHELTVPARLDKQYPRGLLFIPNNFADVPLNRLFKQGQYPCPVEIEKARCFEKEARWN